MSDKITFKTIADVPVNYARMPVALYGTRGKPKAMCGPVEPSFFAALEAWMNTLGELCPWGRPELLVTAGIVGDGHGMHGEGRAIDIDSLWWPQGHLTCKEGRDHLAWYYAVESTLRMHFGVVLDMEYNSAHEDHWHVDDGQPVGWMPKLSRVLFLQAAINHIWGKDIAIDGKYGRKTEEEAYNVFWEQFGGDPSVDRANNRLKNKWMPFLEATARRGFSKQL